MAFRETIVGQGKFFAAAADAKISAVDVRDIAAVAAAALTGEGHAGRTYDLTGPEALTHGEMAEKLSNALDREIQYVNISPEAMMDALPGIGLPLWQAEGQVEDYAHYRRGEASSLAQEFKMRQTGRPVPLIVLRATTHRPFSIRHKSYSGGVVVKVIIFGATGMVGQGVLRECLLDDRIGKLKPVQACDSCDFAQHSEMTRTRRQHVAGDVKARIAGLTPILDLFVGET